MTTSKQMQIVDRIECHPVMRFEPEPGNYVSRLNLISPKLHQEIGWLFEKFPFLGIFERSKKPNPLKKPYINLERNSWRLSACWLDRSLAEAFMGAERAGDSGDFMWNYNEFGSSLCDGGVGICSASENFGKIAFCPFNANSERCDIPIVANSFTEWIERTLDAGPDALCPYWQMPDFIDLGPAIPNDPFYRPIGKTQ